MVFTRSTAQTNTTNKTVEHKSDEELSTTTKFRDSSRDASDHIADQSERRLIDGSSDQSSGVVDQLACVPPSPKAKHHSSNTSQTVAELELELFNSEDSSDDEEFSFSKKVKKAELEGDEVASSMFVIDRLAQDKNHEPAFGAFASNQTKKYSHEERNQLMEELSKAPSSIKVDEAILNADSTLLASTTQDTHSKLMKKAVVSNDFEKRHSVPTYSEGRKAMARKRREEKATTKADWFDMKAPEMTEELEADLEAMQMRGSAASWTGYKKNDYKKGPKFFQIATVQDSPIDFYHSRIVKKDRKRTIVDELLADAEFRKRNKNMYMKAVEKMNKRHPNKKGGRYGTKAKR